MQRREFMFALYGVDFPSPSRKPTETSKMCAGFKSRVGIILRY